MRDTECEGLCEVRVLWRGALWSKMDAEPKTRVANIQKRQRAGEHGCLLLRGQGGLSEGSYGRLGQLDEGKVPVLWRTFRNTAVLIFM